ncbi:MAG: hypothetical protein ACE5E5_06190 [Phycisphaerae bacterium]
MSYLLLSLGVLLANQELGDSANRELGGAVVGERAEGGSPQSVQEGLWPSPKLQVLLLKRFARDLGSQYGFDEAQQAELDQAVLDRWVPYLDSHHEQLKPLVNEYLELKMQLTPPPKEEIQSWAGRALSEFESIKTQLYEGVDDLREVANDLQRVKIDAQAVMLGGALTYGETQLKLWRDGQFDPADFLAPTRTQRRQRREKREEKKRSRAADQDQDVASEKGTPHDVIEEELSLWDQYVVNFVRRFELDDGQRSSAQSVLAEMKQRALSHRAQRSRELAELERQLEDENPTPDEQGEIKKKIQALYGPIDELFAELKRRVELLPTASQRAKVARQEASAHSAKPGKNAPTKNSAVPLEEKASSPSPPTIGDQESDKGR